MLKKNVHKAEAASSGQSGVFDKESKLLKLEGINRNVSVRMNVVFVRKFVDES